MQRPALQRQQCPFPLSLGNKLTRYLQMVADHAMAWNHRHGRLLANPSTVHTPAMLGPWRTAAHLHLACHKLLQPLLLVGQLAPLGPQGQHSPVCSGDLPATPDTQAQLIHTSRMYQELPATAEEMGCMLTKCMCGQQS